MNKKVQSIICWGMTAMLSFSLFGISLTAQADTGSNAQSVNLTKYSADTDYSSYLSENSELKSGEENVRLSFDGIERAPIIVIKR